MALVQVAAEVRQRSILVLAFDEVVQVVDLEPHLNLGLCPLEVAYFIVDTRPCCRYFLRRGERVLDTEFLRGRFTNDSRRLARIC